MSQSATETVDLTIGAITVTSDECAAITEAFYNKAVEYEQGGVAYTFREYVRDALLATTRSTS